MDKYAYAEKVLKSRKAIVIDNKLMKGLGYEDTRTFFEQMGNWGYNTDFGYLPEAADLRVQSYLRAFIRSFLD